MDYSSLFSHIKNKVELNQAEEEAITSRLRQKIYLKNQYIVQEGDVNRYQTFIISGTVRTFYLDENGSEHVVSFGIDDWWVGDICSFTNQTPAEFNTQCLERTTVTQISYQDMNQLYIEVPKLERYFRIVIQKAYGNMTKRIVRNHAMSAKERYMLFTEAHPDITNRVPQYMIASYLGVTKEFLSRMRKRLAQDAKS